MRVIVEALMVVGLEVFQSPAHTIYPTREDVKGVS
jgi:hypothetical protein